MLQVILILVACVLAVLRVTIVVLQADTKSLLVECYKDVAHFFVGGLLGAWLATREGWYGWIALMLTLVEVGAFIWVKLIQR